MKRREFITLLGGAAAVGWPIVGRAEQPPTIPLIGFLHSASAAAYAAPLAAFRKGLSEAGYVEGQNVAIEYRWAEGQNNRLPTLAAELVRRGVAVIVTPGSTAATLAAKAATATIPIVFIIGADPVKIGLVASLNRPGGNATGMTLLSGPLLVKRIELARDLLPRPDLLAVLTNPTNPENDDDLRYVQEAARVIGQRLLVLEVSTESHLPAAFVTLTQQGAKSPPGRKRRVLQQSTRMACRLGGP